MKKAFYLNLIVLASIIVAKAQTTETVSIGPGYANQVWYSLENGIQATQAKNNWDLAFEIQGFTSAILINTAKTDVALYKAPFKLVQWASLVDTAGLGSWQKLYNADTSWAIGAFNTTADPNNEFDLGWGVYNLSNHFVTGDSIYVVQLSKTSYKKLKIDNLGNGLYNFTYADMDGSNEKEVTIAKANYVGKNFAYYNLTTGVEIDREPASASWDLTFVQYTSLVNTEKGIVPSAATGVLHNKGVKVANASSVADVNTFTDYNSDTFKTAINEIGYGWKKVDYVSLAWTINKNLFFVRDKAGKIWKVIFTGFGGSATGNYSFTKEALITTALEDNTGTTTGGFALYPNPSTGEQLTLILDAQTSLGAIQLTVTDAQGNVVQTENVRAANGFRQQELNIGKLPKGIYFVSLGNKTSSQKFIKQ